MANRPGTQAAIGNGQTLNTMPARLWNGLAEELKREDGITLVATQGTRTWQEQYNFWAGYQKRLAGVAGYSHFNPAYHPDDPRANHVAGKCVDAGSNVGYINTREARQFRARCGKWGVRFTVGNEPWHTQIEEDWAAPAILALLRNPQPGTASVGATPIEEKDELMHPFLIQRGSDGRLSILGIPGRGYRELDAKNGEAEYAEVANTFNSGGVKMGLPGGGAVAWPPFRSLGRDTHFRAFSDTGYAEAIKTFTVPVK